MRGGKREISGIITIKIDYGKKESSSGDGRRFFFCGWVFGGWVFGGGVRVDGSVSGGATRDWGGNREGYGDGWGVALLGNGSRGGAFFLRYCVGMGPEKPGI